MRRLLIGSAILATLTAIFYAEEDWRGKRAWENCKRDLEARGIVMDWDKLIPPPVPDDQNFFKADPGFGLEFVRLPNGDDPREVRQRTAVPRIDLSPSTNFPALDTAKTGPVIVAKITVVPSNNPGPESLPGSYALKLSEPDAQIQAGRFIHHTLGEMAIGAQGFNFSALPLDRIVPAQILVQSDATPSIQDLENLVSEGATTNLGRLRVQAADANAGSFRVVLTEIKITPAADYLKWSDQFAPFFDDIREGLKRPYAQIDGDFSLPYNMPVPNFIMMRCLAQTLAQRAQCYLLLGQPEPALRELTLLHDSCRILQNAPTGRPLTLVASMINVAISSVYVTVIADGLRWHSWSEPQLLVLQRQLKEINLPPLVKESLSEQAASSSRTLETLSSARLKKLFSKRSWSDSESRMFWELNTMPRGWLYQNISFVANLEAKPLAAFDITNQLVLPRKFEQMTREIEGAVARNSPWNIAASEFIPNFTKAALTTAKNQTSANEAQIACALERYHLAHGEYPETLDALVPRFIDQLPHDIIGGQPLHYHRSDDGKFVLYSIGWNETDDGGRVDTAHHADGHDNREYGDWVW